MPTTEDFWIERYGEIALRGGNDHFTHHDRNFDSTFEVAGLLDRTREIRDYLSGRICPGKINQGTQRCQETGRSSETV